MLAIACTSGSLSPAPQEDWQTSPSQKTLILISIDGMRWDYLERHNPPFLQRIAREGLRADSLKPIYPSLTFPNHYSIVTGLYADQHGIIGNRFYDATFNETYSLSHRNTVEDGKWYGGEPIWVTARKHGLRANCFFWPGSEAAIMGMRPHVYKAYDESVSHQERVSTVLGWLTSAPSQRPHLITLYFSDVDSAGHSYGPDATETKTAVLEVDRAIGNLMEGIQRAGLQEQVSLVIVSDHGMTDLKAARSIYLSEMIEPKDVERMVVSQTMIQLWPNDMTSLKQRLLKTATSSQGFDVWERHEIPQRFHLRESWRIGPLVMAAREGHVFTKETPRQPYAISTETSSPKGGTHGYDNLMQDMHGIFLAVGPAFKPSQRIPTIESVDVYEIMTRVLGIPSAKNQGNPRIVDSFPLNLESLQMNKLK